MHRCLTVFFFFFFYLSECLSLNIHFNGLLFLCKQHFTVVASGMNLPRDENNLFMCCAGSLYSLRFYVSDTFSICTLYFVKYSYAKDWVKTFSIVSGGTSC